VRRWNGWGDEQTNYPLPDSASDYLFELVGGGSLAPDATFDQVLTAVPTTRLPSHPLISTDASDRLLHARGQSLPDWVALRSGRIDAFPDGVTYPGSDDDVLHLLEFSRQVKACLIPYGGGTSVVGHINPLTGDRPVITMDLSRLNQLTNLDESSCLATFGAGVRGPDLENQLQAKGYTLGHFPQSFELSTLGGWIATRSCGQQSYYYGRIEDLFAGGHIETGIGPLDLPCLPASAAGPDLRHLILGSEGRLGIITRAVVRVRKVPAYEQFFGVFFSDWETGAAAMREIAQSRAPISMARLSDTQETETTLVLSGKERLVGFANRGLSLLGYRKQRCLLVFGVTGDARRVAQGRRLTLSIIRRHNGLFTGAIIGKMWRKSRFLSPYLRNTLWTRGYAIDTLETALPWLSVLPAAKAIKSALQDALDHSSGSKSLSGGLVFSHLSHVYRDGASIYTTFLFPRSADPAETLERWQSAKSAASQVIVACHGTISHQHGVGSDHASYLPAEKGLVGVRALAAACLSLDPNGLLNPGKLVTP
jgi:alkyldihydroxyacetonephosphate synthase